MYKTPNTKLKIFKFLADKKDSDNIINIEEAINKWLDIKDNHLFQIVSTNQDIDIHGNIIIYIFYSQRTNLIDTIRI